MSTIRQEQPGDAPAIRRVLEAAFPSRVEADLVDTLRLTCRDSISLVAVSDDTVVGHVLFTPTFIETASGRVTGCGLAPIAVVPEHQNKGIGSALIRAGIDRLRTAQCPFVIVVGHPAYYPRFGFVRGSTYGIRCQWDTVPDDAFMILLFQSSLAPHLAGVAKYRPEFDETV